MLRRHEAPEERQVDRRVCGGRDRPSRSRRSAARPSTSTWRKCRSPCATVGVRAAAGRSLPPARARADKAAAARARAAPARRDPPRASGTRFAMSARPFASTGSGSSSSTACSARRKPAELQHHPEPRSSSSAASPASHAGEQLGCRRTARGTLGRLARRKAGTGTAAAAAARASAAPPIPALRRELRSAAAGSERRSARPRSRRRCPTPRRAGAGASPRLELRQQAAHEPLVDHDFC